MQTDIHRDRDKDERQRHERDETEKRHTEGRETHTETETKTREREREITYNTSVQDVIYVLGKAHNYALHPVSQEFPQQCGL